MTIEHMPNAMRAALPDAKHATQRNATHSRNQDQGLDPSVLNAPGPVDNPIRLTLSPISLRAANQYVADIHRHHGPVRGHKFSVAVIDQLGTIRGVGIAGRPKSRMLDGQGFLEIVRVATDGTKNACSMLYGALRGAGIKLGYPAHKIITYTLESESGGSLRASGWLIDGVTAGGSWDRIERAREDKHPTEPKTRWVAGVAS